MNMLPEVISMDSAKKKREKSRNKLSSTQEVLYQREFRNADRAAGYKTKSESGRLLSP
jgi:hypothetical protein